MSDRPSSRSPFKTADYPFTNARPYIFLNEIAPANPTIAPLPSGIARAWVQPVIAQDWRSRWLRLVRAHERVGFVVGFGGWNIPYKSGDRTEGDSESSPSSSW